MNTFCCRFFFVSTLAVRNTFADSCAVAVAKNLAHNEHNANSPGTVPSNNLIPSGGPLPWLNSHLISPHIADAPPRAFFCPRVVLYNLPSGFALTFWVAISSPGFWDCFPHGGGLLLMLFRGFMKVNFSLAIGPRPCCMPHQEDHFRLNRFQHR